MLNAAQPLCWQTGTPCLRCPPPKPPAAACPRADWHGHRHHRAGGQPAVGADPLRAGHLLPKLVGGAEGTARPAEQTSCRRRSGPACSRATVYPIKSPRALWKQLPAVQVGRHMVHWGVRVPHDHLQRQHLLLLVVASGLWHPPVRVRLHRAGTLRCARCDAGAHVQCAAACCCGPAAARMHACPLDSAGRGAPFLLYKLLPHCIMCPPSPRLPAGPFLQCISSRGRSCAAGAALAALVGTIWWLGGAITLMSKHGWPAVDATRACRLCVQFINYSSSPANCLHSCASASASRPRNAPPAQPGSTHSTSLRPQLTARTPTATATSTTPPWNAWGWTPLPAPRTSALLCGPWPGRSSVCSPSPRCWRWRTASRRARSPSRSSPPTPPVGAAPLAWRFACGGVGGCTWQPGLWWSVAACWLEHLLHAYAAGPAGAWRSGAHSRAWHPRTLPAPSHACQAPFRARLAFPARRRVRGAGRLPRRAPASPVLPPSRRRASPGLPPGAPPGVPAPGRRASAPDGVGAAASLGLVSRRHRCSRQVGVFCGGKHAAAMPGSDFLWPWKCSGQFGGWFEGMQGHSRGTAGAQPGQHLGSAGSLPVSGGRVPEINLPDLFGRNFNCIDPFQRQCTIPALFLYFSRVRAQVQSQAARVRPPWQLRSGLSYTLGYFLLYSL